MPSISMFEFLLLSIATFRLTHLFVFDEITTFIRRPFHVVKEDLQEDGTIVQYIEVKGKGVQKFFGQLLSCYWCTGVWAAIFLFTGYILFPGVFVWIICILAIAGVASIVEAVVQRL